MQFGQDYQRGPQDYFGGPKRRRLIYGMACFGVLWIVGWQVVHPTWRMGETSASPRIVDTRLDDRPAERIEGAFLAQAPAGVEPAEEMSHLLPEVPAEWFAHVRDNSLLRGAEWQTIFHLMNVAARRGPAEMDRVSAGEVAFIQLYDQPQAYRGRVVTVRGSLRQLQRLSSPQNEAGVATYYMGTLQPVDNPVSPILIYFAELPDGFPVDPPVAGAGESAQVATLRQDIQVQGFFLKRVAYQASDDLRTAPLIVANTIRWRSHDVRAQQDTMNILNWIVLGVIASAVLLMTIMLLIRRPAVVTPGPSDREFLQDLSRDSTLKTATEHLQELEESLKTPQSNSVPPSRPS